ncbi:MAG: hypothetical protein RIQ54_596 [Candidatus Parcubacteria bacterium]
MYAIFRFVSSFVLIGIVASALYIAILYAPADPPAVSSLRPPVAVEVSIVHLHDRTDYGVVDAFYPQFPSLPASVNTAISSVIRTAANEHLQHAQEYWRARIATASPTDNISSTPADPNQFQFYADWVPEYISPDLISITLRYGGFSGGAHGYEDIFTLTYDVRRGRMVSLSDLFPNDPAYLTFLSRFAREQLLPRLMTAYGLSDSTSDVQRQSITDAVVPSLERGTEPESDNFSYFAIRRNGIVWYFPRYQVAAYAAGEQHIFLPRPITSL